MQSRDEAVNLWRHHRKHRHGLVADRREGVNGACGNFDILTFSQYPALVADQHFKLSRQDAEGFVGRIVNMERSLIARKRV